MSQKTSLVSLVILMTVYMVNVASMKSLAANSLAQPTSHPCNPHTTFRYVVVSQSSQYIAATWKNGVRIWQTETGDPIHTFIEDTVQYQYPELIAISPDDTYVLTGHERGVASLWEISSGNKIYSLNLERTIHMVAFLPQGKLFLISDLQESSLWDIETGERTITFSVDNKAHSSTRISSNSKYLVSVYTNTRGSSLSKDFFTAYLWDINAGEQLHSFEGTREAFLSPMGNYLITWSTDTQDYVVWHTLTRQQLYSIDDLNGERRLYAFSLDEKYLYGLEFQYLGASEKDEPVKDDVYVVWDVLTGKQLHRFEVKTKDSRAFIFGDSKYFLIGKAFLDAQDSHSGTLYDVYDIATGSELYDFSITDSESSATSILITPNDKYLVSAIATVHDDSLRLWDLKTGKLVRRFC